MNFRYTLDDLLESIIEEMPVNVPCIEDDVKVILDIMQTGHFGSQDAMGITWVRQRVCILDADTLRKAICIFDEDANFPKFVNMLQLTLNSGERGLIGYVPRRLPRPANAYGFHRIEKTFMFRATDISAASKLSLVAPGICNDWLSQFNKLES